MNQIEFPARFLWGTTTAAHQVEGQNFNSDWWAWEQSPGRIRNGDSSRIACDWWGGGYRQDLDRAKNLGTNAHRMSIEWSRIEPREGEWDGAAVQTYRLMLEYLIELGMTPFVTLHHFSNPVWVAMNGGWENPAVIRSFSRFARRVTRELGEWCSHWITINEPNVYAYQGYSSGEWPPGVRDVRRAFRVMSNMVRAHAGAYYGIKDIQPNAQIGIAHHRRYFTPFDASSALDRLATYFRNRLFNELVLLALEQGYLPFPLGFSERLPEVRGTQDFVGVNYYFTDQVAFDPFNPGEIFGRAVNEPNSHELKASFSSAGTINPIGLERTLAELSRYRKPIYITENGVIDAGDHLQIKYLLSHLSSVGRAISSGAQVRGYFWWTLTDNFEWTEGYKPRFGLYAMDVVTQKRTPRPVTEVYAKIIRENGISEDMFKSYGRT